MLDILLHLGLACLTTTRNSISLIENDQVINPSIFLHKYIIYLNVIIKFICVDIKAQELEI